MNIKLKATLYTLLAMLGLAVFVLLTWLTDGWFMIASVGVGVCWMLWYVIYVGLRDKERSREW